MLLTHIKPLSSGSGCVPLREESHPHALPLLTDLCDLLGRSSQIAVRRGRFELLTERCELRRTKGAAIALQRVGRAPCRLAVSAGYGLAKRRELLRCICEELVYQLGDKRLIPTNAVTQIVQNTPVEYVRHGTRH